jgi:hypothetical protein
VHIISTKTVPRTSFPCSSCTFIGEQAFHIERERKREGGTCSIVIVSDPPPPYAMDEDFHKGIFGLEFMIQNF